MDNFFLYYRRFVNIFGVATILMLAAIALSYNLFILLSSFFVFLITIILVLISETRRRTIIIEFYFYDKFKKIYHKKLNKFIDVRHIDNRGKVTYDDDGKTIVCDLSKFDLYKKYETKN